MRTILYLIRKEFLQIFRDKFIGKAIFGIPIVQMLILVPAITFEIKDIKLCIIDRDMTVESRGLVSQLAGSTFFKVRYSTFSEEEANDLLHKDKCSLILQIPSGFGKEIGKGNPVKVMVSANAINASNAQLSWAYLNGVIRDYNQNIIAENAGGRAMAAIPQVMVTNRYWYNEMLNYKYYMLPGILGILVLAIGFILAGLNLVKEKESGTIEQINVTPVKKYQFITAKIVPFLIIGLIDLAIGLIIGILVFRIPFEGSIALLFLCSAIFLVAVLGLALFLSTFSSTQQQFMFTGFFFMIIFILMSGIFTPLESMPDWAQKIDLINPVAYIMRINRMVILKGSTFQDIRGDVYALIAIAVAFTILAINRYRKTA
ncbi:MAG TPA: ABC transporter permease [Bacteroidales bacterium]|nr:ABC transporter permease [Bacteroidales bacterium]HPT01742.1 ABC transporter permease [Bacteroidales bacterium]